MDGIPTYFSIHNEFFPITSLQTSTLSMQINSSAYATLFGLTEKNKKKWPASLYLLQITGKQLLLF